MDSDNVAFGSPQFWRTAPREFCEFHRVAPRLQQALNKLTTRGYPEIEPIQRVILNLTMLAGVSMAEVTTLIQNGLGPGAMKIARSLLEYAINAEYLRLYPHEFEDYRDWHWVEQKRLLDYLRLHSQNSLGELARDEIERTEREFERVRARFEYQTASGPRLRGSWCSRNLADRAALTDFVDDYRTAYPVGSRILHGSIGGLVSYFNVEEDDHRIAVPPSLDWCVQALITSHSCLFRIVQTLALSVNTETEPPIANLLEDYRSVWAQP